MVGLCLHIESKEFLNFWSQKHFPEEIKGEVNYERKQERRVSEPISETF